MKITDIKAQDARIEIRVWKNDKIRFIANAKKLGIPLTEMIIHLLDGIQVTDRKTQQQLFDHISKLTREMNMIGKNINQATTALHQINNSNKIEINEFKVFKDLLHEYISKQDELKTGLNKIIFQCS